MANVTRNYTIELGLKEAGALKRVLGSLNDLQYENLAIKGELREQMRELWSDLPDDPDIE